MTPAASRIGKWMALVAALLGWMFDGLEMGLFPLVAKPALRELLATSDEVVVSTWIGIITAFFLVGAATGGVVFGWIGDRFGRVRAMMFSVITYAVVSGACGFAATAWQLGLLRFVAALGMGGEWSLGVALVNELWPDRSRAFLAGLIGAAGNLGYLVIALASLGLDRFVGEVHGGLLAIGVPGDFVEHILANNGWRFLMMLGALPALLTFLIRIYVPESTRWQQERDLGATRHWASVDLPAVLVGAVGACGIVAAWIPNFDIPFAGRVLASIVGFVVALGGYTYPAYRFLRRSDTDDLPGHHRTGPTFRRMLIGACLSGVALMGTWGSVQQVSPFTSTLIQQNGGIMGDSRNSGDELARLGQIGSANSLIWASLGAVLGTILAALLADRIGRRLSYFLLCLGSFVIVAGFFRTQVEVDATYFLLVFVMGAVTASFYGWLPLYLPEIFRTSMRATGQGFSFNFGRILAAIGVLQIGNLTKLLGGLGPACGSFAFVYLIGMGLIWLMPETMGRPLPE
jgi:MFS transporter, SHS family, sialic acid transporter